MLRASAWLRTFVGLLFAVLVPILLLVAALILSESLLREADPAVLAVLVVLASVAWAAVLAVVFARTSAEDLRAMLTLAERGGHQAADLDAAHVQLIAALDERNRQVVTLAREVSAIPIADAPPAVVRAVVSATRSVMRDSTWRCAVLTADDTALLPPGVYLASEDDGDPTPIGELERWASASAGDDPAQRLEGPWGAFAVVALSRGDRLHGVLLAPWEGRPDPSPAEIALLSLVGQHAGTALEHSMLYARVRAQADELARLSAIQSDFLRGVTHDLQTPLTSIGALATELRANDEVPTEAQADLDTITHQADRLRRMVAQLLVASRLEAGVFTPQQEVFAVAPLLERTWIALRADRPLELATSGDPHLAIGDADRLEQVLWAVLDNAVKYSPAGSPIEVSVRPDGDALAIAVRDHGAGMDEATRGHAFEQFFRAADARRLAPDGSGVGLYAARGLMEAMGGSIVAGAALGSGTTITIRIPAEPSAGAAD